MTFFLPVVMLWLLSGASAEVVQTFLNHCDGFFAIKQPPTITPTPAFQKICQRLSNVVYFATLYDTSNKIPVYSAYKFDKFMTCERSSTWYIEPQLDGNNEGPDMASKCTKAVTCGGKQALNEDYLNSGYDKGHLAPVYQASSQQCAKATFTLTNAAPQNPSFNRGKWRITEENIAKYLNNNCNLYSNYLVTGVVPGIVKMGKNMDVNVPSHFWTAFCCLDNNNKCRFSGGFIGENMNNPVKQMNVSNLETDLAKLYKPYDCDVIPARVQRQRSEILRKSKDTSDNPVLLETLQEPEPAAPPGDSETESMFSDPEPQENQDTAHIRNTDFSQKRQKKSANQAVDADFPHSEPSEIQTDQLYHKRLTDSGQETPAATLPPRDIGSPTDDVAEPENEIMEENIGLDPMAAVVSDPEERSYYHDDSDVEEIPDREEPEKLRNRLSSWALTYASGGGEPGAHLLFKPTFRVGHETGPIPCTPAQLHGLLLLENLKQQVAQLATIVNLLMAKVNNGLQPATFEWSEEFQFPLESDAELERFEACMADPANDRQKHALVNTISAVGGVDLKRVTWNIPSYRFSCPLSRTINWKGVNKKRAFHRMASRALLSQKFLISYHVIMTFFLPVVMLWLLSGASAEVVQTFGNQCDDFFAVKQPPIIIPTPAFKKICQRLKNVVYYATLYDTSNKIPVYSAYKFEGLMNCKRSSTWYIEPQLDDNNAGANMASKCTPAFTCGSKQALDEDYVNSGYDRGHLAPVYHASSQQWANATFTLTNAAPQNPSFNRGQWRITEENIAKYLNTNCNLYTKYIVTGVVPGNLIIGNNVNVSSHIWTAYCCLDNNNKCQESQGYIGENKNDAVKQMNVSDLEKHLAKLYKVTSFQLFASSTKPSMKRQRDERSQYRRSDRPPRARASFRALQRSHNHFPSLPITSSKPVSHHATAPAGARASSLTLPQQNVSPPLKSNPCMFPSPLPGTFVTQPGFATPTTSSISPRPVNRLSRKRRRAAINSIPADPPVSIQNVPPQASQPVDFYTEDALGVDATEACNSILAEISEAILTNNREVVISSGDQGATATECITVPAKSSVDLPSNQDHFNHELLLGINEKLDQLQETLNIHSEIARRMYGCVDTLLSNSADQGALNRLLLDRTENIQGTLQRIVQSHEDDCSQKQLMRRICLPEITFLEMAGKRGLSDDDLNYRQQMRSVRGRNEHLSLTEKLQEMLDEQIEVFGGDYRNFDMDLQSLNLPEIIDEPSSPNICEIIEEIIEMQDLDFERRSNILQTGDGEINNSAEQGLSAVGAQCGPLHSDIKDALSLETDAHHHEPSRHQLLPAANEQVDYRPLNEMNPTGRNDIAYSKLTETLAELVSEVKELRLEVQGFMRRQLPITPALPLSLPLKSMTEFEEAERILQSEDARHALQQQMRAEKNEASEYTFTVTVQKWLRYAPERVGSIARNENP
ncbi:hypothetical protein E1301_Tti019623 [Triplophysa tibetana]|uniref:Endonuclease domain-containing 1 protein n=1 Tax=Triplophysa tibetana TaxID=1572043 RepID=A0A5A9NY32_9TELE|nr:hypothetical protein E1301_Tti019623 [Triplophysa tibetana]